MFVLSKNPNLLHVCPYQKIGLTQLTSQNLVESKWQNIPKLIHRLLLFFLTRTTQLCMQISPK